MLVKDQPKLQANLYVIKARWVYMLAVAGLMAYLGRPELSAAVFGEPLVLLLGAGAVSNLLLWGLALHVGKAGSPRSVRRLGMLQVANDSVLLALGLYLTESLAQGIVPILFFIPIVESIVLFDLAGPIAVAFLSAGLINIVAFSQVYDTKPYTLGQATRYTFSVSLIYLIVGFFSAYISNLIKERGDLLAREVAVQEDKAKTLEKANRELEAKSGELAAKEMELTSANERLAKLEQAKSKFVSVTTHQLRTPLAAIKWTFGMLAKGELGPVTDEQESFVQKGFDSTEKMIRIVNDLLAIDRLDADQPGYDFKKTDLIAFIDDVLGEFANQKESKKIALSFRKPASLPEIELDQVKLRMVLENLVDNAIKYTPPGGSVEVSIGDEGLNASSGTVEVRVKDTGPGIPLEDQKKIFQKFFRAPDAVRREPDGSGLGLFIAKDIIEKHGGTIWFDSKPGEGTAFRFTLPVHQKKV